MKKVFKTLSAILLATACLVPGLAWAAEPSVTLESNGALKASDMDGVHSVLVEVVFDGTNADKVTGVELKNVPSDTLSSVVYSGGKVTVAVSAGERALNSANSSLGTLNVIAQGASVENPLPISARITAVEYLDTADSTAATKMAAVNAANAVNVLSTQGEPSNAPDEKDLGTGIEGSGNVGGANGQYGSSGNGAITTADYRANGVVTTTQAGQSATGNTGLVKTGDVLAICGIALGAAAIVVVVSMLVTRKKASRKE